MTTSSHARAGNRLCRQMMLLVVCAAIGLCPQAPGEQHAEFLGMEITRDFSLKGIRIPLELEGQRRIGEVTIDEVGMGPRRVDGFMIHLVPQPVVHGMRVRVNGVEGSAGWRQALGRLLGRNALFHQCRIEGIQLVVPLGRESIVIDAVGGGNGRRGDLELRDVTITHSGRTIFLPHLKIPLQGREGDWSLAGIIR